MMLLPATLENALLWHKFLLQDTELFCQLDTRPTGIFVASLLSRFEVRSMLIRCGEIQAHENIQAYIFRTSSPVVLGWAKRFDAIPSYKEFHRTRFLMMSYEWKRLCEKAYLLSINFR